MVHAKSNRSFQFDEQLGVEMLPFDKFRKGLGTKDFIGIEELLQKLMWIIYTWHELKGALEIDPLLVKSFGWRSSLFDVKRRTCEPLTSFPLQLTSRTNTFLIAAELI